MSESKDQEEEEKERRGTNSSTSLYIYLYIHMYVSLSRCRFVRVDVGTERRMSSLGKSSGWPGALYHENFFVLKLHTYSQQVSLTSQTRVYLAS